MQIPMQIYNSIATIQVPEMNKPSTRLEQGVYINLFCGNMCNTKDKLF